VNDQSAHRVVAAAFDSPEEMVRLIAAEPDLLEARTGLGETPLHYLAVENQLRAVILLVESGAAVNTVNEVGGTPLSEAASLGYEDLVEYLLKQGAALEIPGQHELTLHEAARGGSARIVDLVLAAGAIANEPNDPGETALHLAAEEERRLPALEALLEAGANVSLRNAFNETALDVALREVANACAIALVAKGAPRSAASAA
jgi:ankyrin repeat protein